MTRALHRFSSFYRKANDRAAACSTESALRSGGGSPVDLGTGWLALLIPFAFGLVAIAIMAPVIWGGRGFGGAPGAPPRVSSAGRFSHAEADAKAIVRRKYAKPAEIPSMLRLAIDLDSEAVSRAVSLVEPRQLDSMSTLLHCVMVFGLNMPVPAGYSFAERPTLGDVLFNHEVAARVFGKESVFIQTRLGLRNRTGNQYDVGAQLERQSHSGQMLADLAKLGIPLSQAISTADGEFELYDVLADTIGVFNFEQHEIEYDCLALILYLAPNQRWEDRFGQVHSFDDVGKELVNRLSRRSERSCLGIHILEALTYLIRVNQRHSILSQSVGNLVEMTLAENVESLVHAQANDGSWSPYWFYHRSPTHLDESKLTEMRLHVTAHHLDWMLLLPKELAPDSLVFQHAANYLLDRLLQADQEAITRNYCGYSHSAAVLNRLMLGAQ